MRVAVPAASSGGSAHRFVDLDVTAAAWGVLAAVVVALIVFDLWRHRDQRVVTAREAGIETLGYVAVGLAFGVGVLVTWGGPAFGEYLSGFVVEKSLSVDNVFVWAIIFASFSIPAQYQRRVLFWGIFGALVLRALFVFAGAALIARFWWMLLVFGVVLVVSGIKVIRHRDDEGEQEHRRAVGVLARIVPVTDELHGHHFWTRIDGRLVATPLFAALVVVEATDVVFAVDSVPAVLAVSREPYLVLAANAFAILGLRAMYFVLAAARERLHYLGHALGLVLVFVGIKMAAGHWWHMPTLWSLAVIVTILVVAAVASYRRTRSLGGTLDHLDVPIAGAAPAPDLSVAGAIDRAGSGHGATTTQI